MTEEEKEWLEAVLKNKIEQHTMSEDTKTEIKKINKSMEELDKKVQIMAIESTKVKTDLKNFKEMNSKEHDGLIKSFDKMAKSLEDFIENSPNKFASKKTEWLVYTLTIGFIVSVMGLIITNALTQ